MVNAHRGRSLAKPQLRSWIGALVTAVLVFVGSQSSPRIGYVLALSALVMLVVAMYMKSIWPTKSKPEHTLVFALFWGLMLGILGPALVSIFLEGGVPALYDLFRGR